MIDSDPSNAAPATVKAVYVDTEAQRSAYRVVDAIDELHNQLRAHRALECLIGNNKLGGQEGLEQVQRADMAMLLGVLNDNLAAHCAKAREAAVSSAQQR